MESMNYTQDGRMQQQQPQITITNVTNVSSIPSTSGQTVVIIETKSLSEEEFNDEEFAEEESSSDEQSEITKIKGKRTRNPDKWQSNVRKRQRQRGENYIDRAGQVSREKSVFDHKVIMLRAKVFIFHELT
ncbi:hypothetical protein B566_EDAN003114, partial [Ephemera danica]